jgi:hypothetical protein
MKQVLPRLDRPRSPKGSACALWMLLAPNRCRSLAGSARHVNGSGDRPIHAFTNLSPQTMYSHVGTAAKSGASKGLGWDLPANLQTIPRSFPAG